MKCCTPWRWRHHILQNIGKCLPDCTVSYFKSPWFYYPPLRKPQRNHTEVPAARIKLKFCSSDCSKSGVAVSPFGSSEHTARYTHTHTQSTDSSQLYLVLRVLLATADKERIRCASVCLSVCCYPLIYSKIWTALKQSSELHTSHRLQLAFCVLWTHRQMLQRLRALKTRVLRTTFRPEK